MSDKSKNINGQPTNTGSINNTLKLVLSNFSRFKARMWLDSTDNISLYRIEPVERRNADTNQLYEYNDTIFAQYILKRNELNVMLSKLNSSGYYISDRYVDDKLISKLSITDLEQLNQGYSDQFRAYGEFHEGDSTNFNNIVFTKPTKFIFFNSFSSRIPAISTSSLFNKDHPYFPTKQKAI